MITTNSSIEDKKLLGLILPRNTMETSLCVQDAPCITQEFALSSVRTCNKIGHLTKNYRNKRQPLETILSVTFNACRKKGHYANQCPKANNKAIRKHT
ncbi:reverse transcriptase domain-containing protein [Tanacetum coccineum]